MIRSVFLVSPGWGGRLGILLVLLRHCRLEPSKAEQGLPGVSPQPLPGPGDLTPLPWDFPTRTGEGDTHMTVGVTYGPSQEAMPCFQEVSCLCIAGYWDEAAELGWQGGIRTAVNQRTLRVSVETGEGARCLQGPAGSLSLLQVNPLLREVFNKPSPLTGAESAWQFEGTGRSADT